MVEDIFIDNSALIKGLSISLLKNLDDFKKAISEKDSKKLLEIFEKSSYFKNQL